MPRWFLLTPPDYHIFLRWQSFDSIKPIRREKTIYLRALIILTILLVGLSACAEKTTNKSLDFSDPHWMDDFNVFLSVSWDDEVVIVFAMTRGIPDLDFLIVNGDTIPVTTYYDEDRDMSYFHNFHPYTILDSIEPGVPFDYSMATGGVSYSGSLLLPEEVFVEWPVLFSTDSDFEFWWETSPDPDMFMVSATLYDPEYDEIDYDVWQIEGDRRSYAIARSFFRGYSEDEISFDAGIEASNYSASGDFVVLGSSNYEYYESPTPGAAGRSKIRKRSEFPGFPDVSQLKSGRYSIQVFPALRAYPR